MTTVRSKRRRVRQVRPEVLRAVREALITGASAPQVVQELQSRFDEDDIPSERTISNIRREVSSDDSGLWRIEDADPATVAVVLDVLHDVVVRTEGRIGSLTKAEARVLPVIRRATEKRFNRWQAYLWTRWYLAWVRTEQDAADMALLLAAMQADGPWPLPRWWPIERVIKAATGWLPPEFLGVQP
jgi:hypothetical protein